MRKALIIIGVILTLLSLYYFYNLIYYTTKSYEITNYGYGILTGNSILLIAGIVMIYFGFKRKSKRS